MPFATAAARCTLVALLLTGAGGFLHAQDTDTVSKGDIRDISLTGPDADSPFYIERQEAKAAAAQAAREGISMYVPKPPRPPVPQQVKKFFTGMFASVKFGGERNGMLPMLLTVEPKDFSLSSQSELDVTLKVSNPEKETIEFLYPNEQRLEVLTKDSAGNVIGRWSEDRAFDPMEGFAAVNPAEFVAYSERIPTSRMKAGQTYTIEASLSGQEGYTASVQVTPTP